MATPVPVPDELAKAAKEKDWPDDLMQRALNARVPRSDIELWLDTLNIRANTRYWHLSNFGSFYGWAVRQGLTTHDPSSRIVLSLNPGSDMIE